MKEESIILGEMEMGKLKIIENESFFKNESSHLTFNPLLGPGPGGRSISLSYVRIYLQTLPEPLILMAYGAFTGQEHNEVRGYK